MDGKFKKITFSKIGDDVSPYIVKNFILTNTNIHPKDLSFDDPLSFEGAIFMICHKGTCRVKIAFRDFLLQENSILILFPNQIFEKLERSDDFFIEVLAFSPDLLHGLPMPKDFDLYQKISLKPILKISLENTQNLSRYHSFIAETFKNKHNYIDKVIRGLLFSFLVEIFNLYSEDKEDIIFGSTSRGQEIVAQFWLLLRKHYKDGRTASYYSDKLFITPKYLSSTLKKNTGHPINYWIDQALISGAKLMLKSTDLTVLQVSEHLNFPNPSYFGRFFKRLTGLTPKEYRDN